MWQWMSILSALIVEASSLRDCDKNITCPVLPKLVYLACNKMKGGRDMIRLRLISSVSTQGTSVYILRPIPVLFTL